MDFKIHVFELTYTHGCHFWLQSEPNDVIVRQWFYQSLSVNLLVDIHGLIETFFLLISGMLSICRPEQLSVGSSKRRLPVMSMGKTCIPKCLGKWWIVQRLGFGEFSRFGVLDLIFFFRDFQRFI